MSNLIQKKQRGKLLTYFRTRLGMFDYKGTWLKGDCPSCGASLKFGANIASDRTNCFICTYNEKPIDVVVMKEGLPNREAAYVYLRTFEDAPFLDTKIEELIQKPAELPAGFTLLSFGNSYIAQGARNYMEGRGFNIRELSLQGIGYCARGEYKYRIILPFYEAGRLIYFNARQFMDFGSKFKNPAVEDFGIGKSMLIYNVDALAVYRKIYIVESVTNALTLGSNAIAIGGKVISNYQLSKVLKSKVTMIVIILDNDATDYSIQMALKISIHKKVKIIIPPVDKDVNDLGKTKTKKLEKFSTWGKYKDFLKMKLDYERSLDTYLRE